MNNNSKGFVIEKIEINENIKVIYYLLISVGVIFLFSNYFINCVVKMLDILNIFYYEPLLFYEENMPVLNSIYDIPVINELLIKLKMILTEIRTFVNLVIENGLVWFIKWIFENLNDLLYYLFNYYFAIGAIIWAIFYMSLDKENTSFEYSKKVMDWIVLKGYVKKVLKKIKKIIKKIFTWLKNRIPFLWRFSLAASMSTGFIFIVIYNVLLFVLKYFIFILEQRIQIFYLRILWSLLKFFETPLNFILVDCLAFSFIVLWYLFAYLRNEHRQEKEYLNGLKFVKDNLSHFIITYGPPSSGKTYVDTYLAVQTEWLYIKELEKDILEYECECGDYNINRVRVQFLSDLKEFIKKRVDGEIDQRTNWFDYLNKKEYLNHQEYLEKLKILYVDGTMLVANYSIRDPYYKSQSKIIDWDQLRYTTENRVNPENADISNLRRYVVLCISEASSEYNSNVDKDSVIKDGVVNFFGTFSHNTQRKAKTFIDYQHKPLFPKSARACSDNFLRCIKLEDYCTFSLRLLLFLPKIVYKACFWFIRTYRMKSTKIENSDRLSLPTFKRNDTTLLYKLVLDIFTIDKKIYSFFWNKRFKRLTFVHALDDEEDSYHEEDNEYMYIPVRDMMNMYESCFKGSDYKVKYDSSRLKFEDIQTYQGLEITREEFEKQNSKEFERTRL